jgi:GT2 family glycosyltransferase
VVLVDNASSGNTVELIRRDFPTVEIICSKVNLGYGEAVNLAFQHLATEYVAVVNQDLYAEAGWIDRLVDALQDDPRAALATPRIVLTSDPSRLNTCGIALHYTGITPCRGYGRPAEAYPDREEVAAVSGAAFVARRHVFESIGGFDGTFFMYHEDTDLSVRVALAGYHCLYVPSAVVMHEFTPRFSADKLYFLERNRLLLLLKNWHWRTLLLLSPALFLVELAVWTYAIALGVAPARAKLRSYSWLVGHWLQIGEARRQVQRLRRVPDSVVLARTVNDLQLAELGTAGHVASAVTSPFFRGWRRVIDGVVSW